MLSISPVLISLLTAVLTMMLYQRKQLQIAVSITGAIVFLFFAVILFLRIEEQGPISVAMGGWPLPFAIEFVGDRLSGIMILITAVLGLGVLLYQRGELSEKSPAMAQPLVHSLIAAVCGVVLTADLFNLYVWFELMLVSVLGLLLIHGGLRNLEAAFKYFALNLLGTLLFLTAVALIYGVTGQLNYSALEEAVQRDELQQAIPIYMAMLFTAFLLKSAAFPLYFWLPASYHCLPAPLLALIGGLITKVSIYVILRMMGEVFIGYPAVFSEALGWIAIITMVSGVLGAAFHWDLRRILAFHIISQIGYLLLAIALASADGAAAGMFFMTHNIIAKATLFLIAGLMWQAAGHYDLRRIGGLYPARPLLAFLFLIAGFSLVGIPPSSGFWGKFLLVQEAFSQGHYAWGGFALGVGVLTLYSMIKIWIEGFWKPHPDGENAIKPASSMSLNYLVVIVFVTILIVIGVYPEPLINYSISATEGLWTW